MDAAIHSHNADSSPVQTFQAAQAAGAALQYHNGIAAVSVAALHLAEDDRLSM